MLVFILVLGLTVGSFINVFIDRSILKESLLYPPSHCDHCKEKLKIRNLIPVISYIIQKGKCSYCHKKLSIQYPIVELLCGLIFVISYFKIDNFIYGLIISVESSLLLGMSIIDIKTKDIYIKHLIIVFIINLFKIPFKYFIKMDIMIKIIFLLVLTVLGYLLCRRGKIGLGDILLFAILTSTMYFNEISVFLIYLSIISISTATYIIIKYKDIKYKIPFVPLISLSYFLTSILYK